MLEDIIAYTPMYVTFFWAVALLLTKRENNRAKSFLGIFMSVAFLLYLSHAVFFKQDISVYQIFDPVYIFSSLSVYPLYYWYIKLLTVETDYRWYNLRSLIPAAFFSLTSIVLYRLMSEAERSTYIHFFLLERSTDVLDGLWVQLQVWVFYITRIIFAIQVLFFLIHGRRLVLRYNNHIANFYSNLESKTILWVNLILYSFLATAVMSIVFNLIGRGTFLNAPNLLLIPSFIFSVLLFFIGLQGYMQNHSVAELVRDEEGSHPEAAKKFNNEQLHDKLVALFAEQKVYIHPDLKITDVSRQLRTNRSYVSALINTKFSCSFNEFVNQYRIIEAKKLLSDKSTENFSLNYIAEAVGFGSVGTFIRVFRDFEDTTPGKFREETKTGTKQS